MVVDVRRVAHILGGKRVLHRHITSFADLERAVIEGLPIRALDETAEYVSASGRDLSALKDRLVPRATRSRRERLKPAEGEKVERLARLMALAEAVWEDREDARSFMNEEHPRFEGRTPIEMADTELGARRVEDLLMKLEYGLPA
jgi:putative toxin-antitoxin system antitoxin component (TIGR02293 family)